MKTPKKRVTLKTPKRSAKTTFKSKTQGDKDNSRNIDKNISRSIDKNINKNFINYNSTTKLTPSNYKFINDLDTEIQNTEKELILSLQKENEFLRNTNLYVKFLGLDISQVGSKYIVKYNVDKENRYLHFELVSEDDMYVYSLVRSENLEELGILGDEISFEKEQVAKFFYKVMEIMISD